MRAVSGFDQNRSELMINVLEISYVNDVRRLHEICSTEHVAPALDTYVRVNTSVSLSKNLDRQNVEPLIRRLEN